MSLFSEGFGWVENPCFLRGDFNLTQYCSRLVLVVHLRVLQVTVPLPSYGMGVKGCVSSPEDHYIKILDFYQTKEEKLRKSTLHFSKTCTGKKPFSAIVDYSVLASLLVM